MTMPVIPLNGTLLHPDASGALFWPEQGWLLVADLHLEKGSAYARFGQLLPPYDTAATLTRLEAACRHWRPRRVVCLGDSFHDADAAGRINAADGRRIAALTTSHEWVWISGNHDPAPPAGWGGLVTDILRHGPLVLRHAAEPAEPAGEISGHYHPKAVTHVRGRRLSARCFVSDGQRLILPAFGAYAGGLNVLDPAIRPLFGHEAWVWVLGGEKLHRLALARLTPDTTARQRPRQQAGLRPD